MSSPLNVFADITLKCFYFKKASFGKAALFIAAQDFSSSRIINVPKFSDRQFWANSVDPEQSDQGLHCLLRSACS